MSELTRECRTSESKVANAPGAVCVGHGADYSALLSTSDDRHAEIRISQVNEFGHESLAVQVGVNLLGTPKAQSVIERYRKLMADPESRFADFERQLHEDSQKSSIVQSAMQMVDHEKVTYLNTMLDRRVAAQRAVSALGLCDELTGLPTRSILSQERELRQELQRFKAPVDLLFCDVRGVGLVNTFGFREEADLFLARIAEGVKSCFHPDAFAIRYGGDEFLFILPSQSADEFALRIRKFEVGLRALRNEILPVESKEVRELELMHAIRAGARELWGNFIATREGELYRDGSSVTLLEDFRRFLKDRLGQRGEGTDDIGELSVRLARAQSPAVSEEIERGGSSLLGIRWGLARLLVGPKPTHVRKVADALATMVSGAKCEGNLNLAPHLVELLIAESDKAQPSTSSPVSRFGPVRSAAGRDMFSDAREFAAALQERRDLATDPAVEQGVLRLEQVRSFPLELFSAQSGPWFGTRIDLAWFGLLNNHLGPEFGDQLLALCARKLRALDPTAILVRISGGELLCLRTSPIPPGELEEVLTTVQLPLSIALTAPLPAMQVEHLQKRALLGFGTGEEHCPELGSVRCQVIPGSISGKELFGAVVGLPRQC
jgi:diguanylate cyclase (GGDEF)-like protein